MKLHLFNGSDPVLLEIEDTKYKPIISLGNVSAELTPDDIESLAEFFSEDIRILISSRDELEEEVEELEDVVDNLKEERKELEDKVADLEEQRDELLKEIGELK